MRAVGVKSYSSAVGVSTHSNRRCLPRLAVSHRIEASFRLITRTRASNRARVRVLQERAYGHGHRTEAGAGRRRLNDCSDVHVLHTFSLSKSMSRTSKPASVYPHARPSGAGVSLWGLASRAAQNGDRSCSMGSVFTRVDAHRDWVESVLASLAPRATGRG
jgi:hypothetical protein